MSKNSLKKEELNIVEALLASSSDVLTQSKVDLCFDHEAPRLDQVAKEIQKKYDKEERAFTIEKVAGGYRFITRPEYEPWIRRLHSRAGRISLSRAALETVAIVAYKGPVTRMEVESIRGVNSGGVIRTLLEKKLIRIKGRVEGPGRPLLYVVTNDFLISFGLNTLSDLPKPREISELISESPWEETNHSPDLFTFQELSPDDAIE